MTNDLEQLISLIFATSRMIRRETCHGEKMSLDSYLKIGTLIYISEHKDPTMKEVADFLNIKPPSVTSLVNGLVKSGQIERVTDKSDKRIIRLGITAVGKKILADGLDKKREKIRAMLSNLDATDRKNLINILTKLV